MMWEYRTERAVVSDLVPGQVVILGYDPESERLNWGGVDLPAPHLIVVDVTIESNVIHPGTAARTTTEITTPLTEAIRSFTVTQAEMHTVGLLYEGRGYEAQVRGHMSVDLLGPHHPRCAECGELWPCREERLDFETRRFACDLDDRCAHCGEPLGAARAESFFDGVTTRRYHAADKYRACRRAWMADAWWAHGRLGDRPGPDGSDATGDGSCED